MKVFVTGVGGQLGHDVVNGLEKRGHESIGSDIQAAYSGIQDGSAVTRVPYIQLDIAEQESVKKAIETIKPDAIIHCAAWTNVDGAEIRRRRTSFNGSIREGHKTSLTKRVRKTESILVSRRGPLNGLRNGCEEVGDERYCISRW